MELLKLFLFFAILIIGYVAYTGADVSKEYDSASKVRDIALNEVVDPIAKKVLKEASESELDKIIDSAAGQYQNGVVNNG